VKILVTGAAGFIGFHTARRLLERGEEVVGLDNLNEYYDINLKMARLKLLQQDQRFRFIKLDLADAPGMAGCFARSSSVSCTLRRRRACATRSMRRTPTCRAMWSAR
jgi:UDP-glucuronate 4-epimerase